MAKISVKQLKEMIREAVREQIEEQLSGGISVAGGAQKTSVPQRRPQQPGGAQGLAQSTMSVEQLVQQYEQAQDPGQKQEYLQAFGMKLKGLGLNDLVTLVKGNLPPELKQLAASMAGQAFQKAVGPNVPPPPAWLGKSK